MPKSRNRWSTPSRFPRTARVNEVLREVIASELERSSEDDARLDLVTVTGVECDPDLRHATVYFSSFGSSASDDEVAMALEEKRKHFQATVGHEVRMKRTPLLKFLPDPAIADGQRVESILSAIRDNPPHEES